MIEAFGLALVRVPEGRPGPGFGTIATGGLAAFGYTPNFGSRGITRSNLATQMWWVLVSPSGSS